MVHVAGWPVVPMLPASCWHVDAGHHTSAHVALHLLRQVDLDTIVMNPDVRLESFLDNRFDFITGIGGVKLPPCMRPL